MEETQEALSLIFIGCELAKVLQPNLPNLANKPNFLLNSCGEIVSVFNKAMNHLNSQNPSPYTNMVFEKWPESGQGAPELPSSCYTQPIEVLHDPTRNPFDVHLLSESTVGVAPPWELGLEILATTTGMMLPQVLKRMDYFGTLGAEASRGARREGELQETKLSDSGKQSKRRKNDRERCTMKVAGSRMGNLEVPPNDGYTWRKYGQKEILGSRYPRSYYRCTHRNLYKCEAKKQVQQMSNDTYTFEVTYRNRHTCQTKGMPLFARDMMLETTQAPPPPPPATSIGLRSWYSSNSEVSEKDKNTPTLLHRQTYRDFATIVESSHFEDGKDKNVLINSQMGIVREFDVGGESSHTCMHSHVRSGKDKYVRTDSQVGMFWGIEGGGEMSHARKKSSHVQDGREMELPVADLADVMLNSGGSSNSIEDIFSSKQGD
ncbi:WRKY transcription factor 55-like [Tasmannia lanceolata]|uniref:WRKY transcription factor 55-like n=1 Tax=Tasmannia lanceolata TaxID=3420 RepID=UPI0040630326